MGSATNPVISLIISSFLAKLGTPKILIQVGRRMAEAEGSIDDLEILTFRPYKANSTPVNLEKVSRNFDQGKTLQTLD